MYLCLHVVIYVCMYVCNGLIPFGSRVLEPNYKFFETFKFKPNRLNGFKLKQICSIYLQIVKPLSYQEL